jgi:hypothetical protein
MVWYSYHTSEVAESLVQLVREWRPRDKTTREHHVPPSDCIPGCGLKEIIQMKEFLGKEHSRQKKPSVQGSQVQ